MTASDFTAPQVALEQCVRSTNATREKWGPRADPKGTEDLGKTRPRRIVFPPRWFLVRKTQETLSSALWAGNLDSAYSVCESLFTSLKWH